MVCGNAYVWIQGMTVIARSYLAKPIFGWEMIMRGESELERVPPTISLYGVGSCVSWISMRDNES
jgi:hypothetical protein